LVSDIKGRTQTEDVSEEAAGDNIWPGTWVQKFQRDILPSSSGLKTEAICYSRTLVHTSQYHNTEKSI
jgi:hypothetical protein